MIELEFTAENLSILTLWLFTSICLLRIILIRRYRLIYKVLAFIPFLHLFTIAKIVKQYCTDLLGNLFVIILITAYVSSMLKGGIQSIEFNISDNTYYLLKFLSITIMYLPQNWYIWRKIAKEGKHTRPDLLGILVGIPIIGTFAAFHISWKGEW